jgi:eukaryotic-like serine/threonine-protein kinase
LTPERWAQVEELFHRAAECDPPRRAVLLDQACANDSELRQHLEALLSSDHIARGNMQAVVRSEFDAMAFSLTGETVSHYRILGGLGGGGMGLVYRAEDIKLGRRVAIKFLPEDSAKDPAALRRFEREARAASALEHPSICPIYEFGEHNGQPFMVMPLLEGQTIEAFVREQGLPTQRQQIQRLLDTAIQVVKGLESAHDHGIIHRDIKPSNIFMTTDGQAKILDFGVAKLARGEHEERNGSDALGLAETAGTVNLDGLSLSRTGAVVGTAAYMSPEQVRGEKVDARTDIFSFGLVLYEMATGKRAFSGNTWPILQEAVLRGNPKPARELNPTIPSKLEGIINKAIEKNRDARFQTAAEVRGKLEILQRQLAPRHLPRGWAMVLIAAGLVLAGTLTFMLSRPPKTISVAPEIKLRQLTSNSSENPIIGGAISPDGKYLAYSDAKGLHIKLIDSGETRTVPQPKDLKNENVRWDIGAWFPDSTRLLLNSHPSIEAWNEWNSTNTRIWMVSVLGGAPINLRDHALACGVSPDGTTVSFITNNGKLGEREVWFMGSNGEHARKHYDAKEGTGLGCWSWSPDGKYYGWILNEASGTRLLSQKIEGGPIVTVFGPDQLKGTNDIVWLHDGRVVYNVAEPETGVCNYWMGRIDADTGKRLEQPRRLTNWPSLCEGSGSVSRDDKKLAFSAWAGFFTSYVAELEAGGKRFRNLRHFSLEDSDNYPLAWTPDSKSVIMARHRKPDNYGLYKQSLDSDTPESSLSSGGAGWLSLGVVSPDGKWVIARAWQESEGFAPLTSRLPIMRFPISGGNPETIMELSHPALFSCARPPSTMCVIAEQSDNNKQMIVSSLDPLKGRGPELSRFDLDRPVDVFLDSLLCFISPDGNRLAVARSPQGVVEIYSLRGQLLHRISSRPLGKIGWLAWTPDLKGFFVTRKIQGDRELLHIDFQGHVESLRRCVGEACQASPSPDGKHLAILDRSQVTNMWMMENF